MFWKMLIWIYKTTEVLSVMWGLTYRNVEMFPILGTSMHTQRNSTWWEFHNSNNWNVWKQTPLNSDCERGQPQGWQCFSKNLWLCNLSWVPEPGDHEIAGICFLSLLWVSFPSLRDHSLPLSLLVIFPLLHLSGLLFPPQGGATDIGNNYPQLIISL